MVARMPGLTMHRIGGDGVVPFLKWPGGKRWLVQAGLSVPQIDDGAAYHEPFVGAGSLFFALRPRHALLSDVNPHLIDAYRGLRSSPRDVIAGLNAFSHDASTYKRVRLSNPRKVVDRAVRFIYLNRTAFAGIYRENRAGSFNVPYGNDPSRRVCQPEILRSAAAALRCASVRDADFIEATRSVEPGDLVYFDPPYITTHQNNGFLRYNRHLFTWEKQVELATEVRRLADLGAHVLVSNTSHEDVLNLYKDFMITNVQRKNQVSRNPAHRGFYQEAVIASFEGAISPTHLHR